MMKWALLATAACAFSCLPNRNVCTSLRDELKRCGFPITELECSRLDRSALEDVLQRVEEHGCEGASRGEDRAVDPRLCLLGNWSCPASPTPEPAAQVAKHPLVFVSGIDSTAIFDWNPDVLDHLARQGHNVHHVRVMPWATTAERADDLWQSLLSLRRFLGGAKVNLVCYAVGGLDCRYLVSPTGLFRNNANAHREVMQLVASVTTIATPHRGTRVAEAGIQTLHSSTVADALEMLFGSEAPATIPDDAAVLRTLDGLTLDALSAFNRQVMDAPGVYYQSWAGVSHVLARSSESTELSIRTHCTDEKSQLLFFRHQDTRDAMNEALWATAPFSNTTRNDDGRVVNSPSDGMISVASAKWGVFRGCLPADHYDVIGQIGHTTRDPLTGFDAAEFYAFVASDLAGKGL
jgi:triacylglycerol lipase